MSLRNVEVDGICYTVPSYVSRVIGGWQARPPQQKTTYFADSNYGGTQSALRECVHHLQDMGLVSGHIRRDGRQSKTIPLGASGVFLQVTPKRGRRSECYSLHVVLPDRRRTSIYVGTEATYQERLPGKIEQAIARQEEVRKAQARKALEFVESLKAPATEVRRSHSTA